MVTTPAINAPNYPLRTWDVITAIGGYNIDNEGMVTINDDLRLLYRYLIPHLTNAGSVPLSVYRDGKPLMVNVPVQTEPKTLLKFHGVDAPSYFIYGPFVFMPVYAELSDLITEASVAQYFISSENPVVTRGAGDAAFDGEQLIVVPSLLPHQITQGYEAPWFGVLESINGIKIKNLRHLAKTLRQLDDDFVVFEWADSATETMVFRRNEITAATEEILELNGIRAQCSKDLRDVWVVVQ